MTAVRANTASVVAALYPRPPFVIPRPQQCAVVASEEPTLSEGEGAASPGDAMLHPAPFAELLIPHLKTVYLQVRQERVAASPNRHRNCFGASERAHSKCFSCGGVGHFQCECAYWKTRLCLNWRFATCIESVACPFAHGESDVRCPHRCGA